MTCSLHGKRGCDVCRLAKRRLRDRLRKRPSPSRRGYGRHHRRLRETWRQRVEAGLVDCARCGETIEPGTPWDLGHDDHDRKKYVGPEHASCNRATSGRREGEAEWRGRW